MQDGSVELEARLAPEAGRLVEQALGAAAEAPYAGETVEQAVPGVSAETSESAIEVQNREAGLAIDSHTCESLWDSTLIDWSMAAENVLACDGMLHAVRPP